MSHFCQYCMMDNQSSKEGNAEDNNSSILFSLELVERSEPAGHESLKVVARSPVIIYLAGGNTEIGWRRSCTNLLATQSAQITSAGAQITYR